MGQRSRKRRPADPASAQERMARGYARGRIKDEEARAKLKPLAPGERPRAVTVAAVVAALIAAGNVALVIGGYELEDGSSPTGGALLFAAIMAAAAVGMWRCKYWAVLGFEALLGIAIVFAALSLMVASNLGAVLLCLAIIAAASPLFWFLIRAMARIQLPVRRPEDPVS